MFRRLLAAGVLLAGVVVAQLGILGWWVDREVTDPERVQEMAATIVRSEEFRTEFAPQIVDQLVESIPAGLPIDGEQIEEAVSASLTNPEFVAEFTAVLGDLYGALFEGAVHEVTTPEGVVNVVEIEIAPLQAQIANALETLDPELSAAIADISTPGVIQVPTDSLPDLRAVESGLGRAWRVAVVLGAAICALGVLMHPRKPVALRRIGILFLIGAGAQQLGAWLIINVGAPNVPDGDFGSLATIAATTLLASLTVQAITQAILAGALIILGTVWIWVPRITAPARVITATMGA